MSRFRDVFPGDKPIIAMAHVPPLPGTPLHDAERGIDGMVETVRADLRILLDGGVDGASTNIASFLQVADGCIVGSDLKVDGYSWNPVDPARVRRFMEAARS